MNKFHPVFAAVLAAVWCLLERSFTWPTFVVGYALAAGTLWLTSAFWPWRVRLRRPGVLLRLLGTFALSVVAANLRVAWLALAPGRATRPARLTVPLALDHELAITALAWMITLTPGTLSVDLAPERDRLYVHCLDTDDPDAVVAQIKRQFEGPLKEVLRCWRA